MCRFMQAIQLTILVFLLAGEVEGSTRAEEAARDQASAGSEHDDMAFVFAGMRRERGRLRSGVGQITEKQQRRENSDEENAGNVEEQRIQFAFDGQTKLRFDRDGPGMVIDATTLKPNEKDPSMAIAQGKQGRVLQFWYTDGEKSCFWQGDQPIINLGRVGAWAGKEVHYFDVRALGLYNWVAYSHGYNFDKVAEAFRTMNGLKKVDKKDPGLWVITWETSDSLLATQWRVQVDVEHGFTPRRMDVLERPAKPPDSPWALLETAETNWEQRAQVWAPVSHKTTVFRARQPIVNVTLQIHWEEINGPIPARYFHYEDFQAPDAVGVVDNSLGHGVFVKPFQPQAATPAAAPGRSWLRVVLIMFVLVLLLWIIFYQIRKIIRNAKPNPAS